MHKIQEKKNELLNIVWFFYSIEKETEHVQVTVFFPFVS